jgi:phosphohistidine phosphatase
MDLILWRHAEAVDAQDGWEDLDRALTTRGERHAARMAHWLNQNLAATTRVLVSPARRCQQTARALERKFKTVTELAPGGTVPGLLLVARWPDAKEPVLVVGHQTMLGPAAAYLLANAEQPWRMKKGAIWWLRRRQSAGEDVTVLVAVRGPESV